MFRVQSRPHKAEETRERGSRQEAAAVTCEGAGLRSPASLCFHQGCSRCGRDRPARRRSRPLAVARSLRCAQNQLRLPRYLQRNCASRRFGSSKHQGRIDANANTAQRLRHWVGKRSLTRSAGQASSFVLGSPGIILKKATYEYCASG